ncbi:MAG: redoxin domain-containing protein [Vallitaleaceae bacterium]|jgi:thiol-disulfide isomerase/thioredoxin|nr:redoxin domain-containing protein [Vallitaleaceae bacterium]
MKKYMAIGMMLILMSTILIGCGVKDDINKLDANSDNTSGNGTDDDQTIDSTSVDSTSGTNDVTGDTSENQTSSDQTSDPTSEQATSSSDGPVLILPEGLPDGRDGIVDFADYEGKMLFVNFFGTWCTYCMQEMPDFQKFTDNYSDKATIVIVDALETESIDMQGVVDWYNENGYTMQLAFDTDKSKTAEYYGAIQGFPTTFVFDEDQNFLGYIGGMMDYTMLEQIMTDYSKK